MFSICPVLWPMICATTWTRENEGHWPSKTFLYILFRNLKLDDNCVLVIWLIFFFFVFYLKLETLNMETFDGSVLKFARLIMQNSLTFCFGDLLVISNRNVFSLHLASFPSRLHVSRCPIGRRACAISELITDEAI